ncbi:MAG: IS1096 element passenger TnpR family protein [Acidimicrobiales bacterium]
MSLADLGLRIGERFRYDYDFTDDWRHDIRVEQVMAADPNGQDPRCTGGRRSGPPEDYGGPWEAVSAGWHRPAGNASDGRVEGVWGLNGSEDEGHRPSRHARCRRRSKHWVNLPEGTRYRSHHGLSHSPTGEFR